MEIKNVFRQSVEYLYLTAERYALCKIKDFMRDRTP